VCARHPLSAADAAGAAVGADLENAVADRRRAAGLARRPAGAGHAGEPVCGWRGGDHPDRHAMGLCAQEIPKAAGRPLDAIDTVGWLILHEHIGNQHLCALRDGLII